MSAAVSPGIFKAYDIRGVYGEELDEGVAEQIGRAFARVLAERSGKRSSELRIGVGRDMRLSAARMAAGYRDGLVAEGAHVLDAGMVATEMLYWLVGAQELDGGLMCTASHNPAPYTGAKLVERGALPLSGESGIRQVRRAVEDGLGEAAGRAGWCEPVDVSDGFRRAVLRFIDPSAIRPMKVVLDGGNGMAGPMLGPILDRLAGLELIPSYWEPDGTFPDH